MAEGEFALINEHLTAAMQKPPTGWNPVGEHEILTLMADAAAAQRDIAVLRDTAERAAAVSRQLGHGLYQAVSLRALGILQWLEGKDSDARGNLLAALEIFQKLETRWQAGRTWFDLAELQAAQGMRHEAAEYYTRAIAAFEDMQAIPFADRTRAALAKTLSSSSSLPG